MTRRAVLPVDGSRDSLVGVAQEQGRWRWFAAGCFVVGAGIGLALVLLGASLPAPGPLVLLALALAIAVNRFALFPTELAVTAEVAVLMCAIVGFRSDSVYAGAWLLGFLAGPLDVVHWWQRSYARMAYNAGNRMLATLAAAFAFDVAPRVAGESFASLAIGALLASVVFALVEVAIGTALLRVRSAGGWRDALRVELPMELLTVPLGLAGAVAGYLATDVGWWSAVVVLVGTVFVPELVLVHGRSSKAWRRAAPALVASAVIAVLAIATPLPGAPAVAGLVAVAVVIGAESRVDGSPTVPVAAAAVVGAALVAGGDAAPGAAVLGATVATAVAGVLAVRARWWAPVVAASATLAVALAYDRRPSVVVAAAAAVAFGVLAGAGARPTMWSAPLAVVAVCAADGWRGSGVAGGLLLAAGLAVTMAAAAVFGAAPWHSRVLAPLVTRRATRRDRSRVVVAGAAAVSAVCTVLAAAMPSTRSVLLPVAAAACASVATIALVAVRQWRFAPRARARDVVLVGAAALTTLLVDARAHGDVDGWTFAALAASITLSVAVVWPLTRLVDGARSRATQRMPDSRSASR